MTDDHRQIKLTPASADKSMVDELRNTTVQERLDMVWRLTVDAWAKKGIDANQPMQKHVTRLIRLKDDV